MRNPSRRLQLLAQLETEMNHQSNLQHKLSLAERIKNWALSLERRYTAAIEKSQQACHEIELGIRLLLDGRPLAYV